MRNKPGKGEIHKVDGSMKCVFQMNRREEVGYGQ